MAKKPATQAQKMALWLKRSKKNTDPEEFYRLAHWLPNPPALFGVDRVTLARWESGQSRIPFAAAQLARLLNGEFPRHFGDWHGWRFLPDGVLYPPGWGEGVSIEDVLNLWTWKRRAFMAQALECENANLKKRLAFLENEKKPRQPLGFAVALVDVLSEN